MKIKILLITLFVTLLIRYNLRSYENIENTDWMTYMNESCAATLTGKAKSFLYNDLDLWSDVNISMDGWKDSMLTDKPADYCQYLNDEKRQRECLAGYQSKWDWYNRCYSIAYKNAKDAQARGQKLFLD